MGRIEEALRRAAEDRSSPEEQSARRRPEVVETPFVSAWQFEPQPLQPLQPSEVAALNRKAPSRPPSKVVGLAPSPASAPSVQLESQLAMGWPQPFAPEVAQKLVVARGMNAEAVAQYRKLAAALQGMQLQRAVKTVMVAGAVAGDGATLTATNLALTLSEFCARRVLLVDSNLLQPRVHELFQVSARTGLNDALRADGQRKLPVIELTRKLVLLPAGRPEADLAGALGSPRMRELLAEASAAFDWVVVDSAPVTQRPDTSLLAALVDVNVLVIDRATPRELIDRAIEGLGRDRLAGVVLNRAAG